MSAEPTQRAPQRERIVAIVASVALIGLGVAAASARAAITQTTNVTDTQFETVLDRVEPSVAGVTWATVRERDEITVTNRSRETVTVYGYCVVGDGFCGGPYARLLPDGTVQVNENSQAYYLNQGFYATDVPTIPPSVSADGLPSKWTTIATDGRFTWHDHRIHYTSTGLPASVQQHGAGRRQVVFTWRVPIAVGATRGYLFGTLYWLGRGGSSISVALIVALAIVVAAGVGLLGIGWRRRVAGTQEAW